MKFTYGTGECKAGRELDALVAEKVMGRPFCGCAANGGCSNHTPLYSSDIAAAWEVFDKLSTEWLCPRIFKNIRGQWVVEFHKKADHSYAEHIEADTAPHAICLAALAAVAAKGGGE